MKKEYYEKPTMEVVQLQHKELLMASNVSATMEGEWSEVTI